MMIRVTSEPIIGNDDRLMPFQESDNSVNPKLTNKDNADTGRN